MVHFAGKLPTKWIKYKQWPLQIYEKLKLVTCNKFFDKLLF